MFKFCLFHPSSSISYSFYSVNSVLVSLCTSSSISAINTKVRLHSTSSLRQINGSVSVWIFLFIYFSPRASQNDVVFPYASLYSYYGLWHYFALWSVKVTGSKLTARSLGLDDKICSMAYSPFQLQTRRSVHHHSISFHDKLFLLLTGIIHEISVTG